MVAEVVLSVMGNRSDRRFPNLSCPWALEAAEVTRRRRADFHQGPERTMKLLKQAEYMAATGFTFHPTIAFRSGLGPYKPQLRDLPRSPLCGGPRRRVLNPDGEHQLPRLTRAIGHDRRPTQLVHFITPYSPQPTNLTRDGVLRRHRRVPPPLAQ